MGTMCNLTAAKFEQSKKTYQITYLSIPYMDVKDANKNQTNKKMGKERGESEHSSQQSGNLQMVIKKQDE